MAENAKTNPFNNQSSQKVPATNGQAKGKAPTVKKGKDLRSGK